MSCLLSGCSLKMGGQKRNRGGDLAKYPQISIHNVLPESKSNKYGETVGLDIG